MSIHGCYLFGRASFQLMSNIRGITSLVKPVATKLIRPSVPLSCRPFARSFYFLTRQNPSNSSSASTSNVLCNCGCSSGIHTKGDKELVEFLKEEIAAESKAQKSPKLPKIEGFELSTDGSNVTLTRTHNKENIKIKLNVNHTVDTDVSEPEVNESQDKVEMAEMKSKPSFQVEIQKGDQILLFGCNFVQDFGPDESAESDSYNDVFNIDELTIFEGEKKDSTYSVSGEIMDGYLYDLLMNYLEERGVSNEFAEKLVEYCTSYEHKLYIGLLETVKSFVSK